ncbi:capsular exopolysaccharide biosynthesis protein (Wzm) [Vibrio orientalis CIP 102891 = ATCC 33934]|uniref:Wzm n=1 Tax=Vibrio orientalis CIP 102891 = ATCC 33934 TaxID=675816 RepID=C9QDE7_VIBOR|nr:polysaccharide pyruvyl transferase family protein [Vibrio orientalis]EEX95049.1 wzm [Vibrio orientalis CIP 102891 = ATCC 33934]EGU52109.1 capsular exopolysaccharide biosynthesis protein (Wzm) [Vibrio orientalis CIP 102891 = ATCC 33934]
MGFNTLGIKLGVLNTSIVSTNLGDEVIMNSAQQELVELFPLAQKVQFPTHERLTRVGFKRQREVSVNFLCGTNCLNSHMLFKRQWNVGFVNTFLMAPTVALGVGWGSYEGDPDIYTRSLLKRMLSDSHLHSVRDSYTESKLRACGIGNVINTGCPTLWRLTPSSLSLISSKKGKDVVFTLTDYRPNREADAVMISVLQHLYRKVYFWIQGSKDFEYYQLLPIEHSVIEVISPSIDSITQLFSLNPELDYVGTRLHGGVLALQHHKRSIIIGVDNRAKEKQKDFGLPVIFRPEVATELDNYKRALIDRVEMPLEVSLRIPFENISTWKSQF